MITRESKNKITRSIKKLSQIEKPNWEVCCSLFVYSSGDMDSEYIGIVYSSMVMLPSE